MFHLHDIVVFLYKLREEDTSFWLRFGCALSLVFLLIQNLMGFGRVFWNSPFLQ